MALKFCHCGRPVGTTGHMKECEKPRVRIPNQANPAPSDAVLTGPVASGVLPNRLANSFESDGGGDA
jgi:hypothetical protein